MTFRSLAALTVLTVTAGTAVVAIPAAARATTQTPQTLHVSGWNCSDGPNRALGQNYCTVQAAVDAAQPGDTVLLATGSHIGAVTLTHSGTPDAPITISGADPNLPSSMVGGVWGDTKPAFTLNAVHDIVLTSLNLSSQADAVVVNGGADITVSRTQLYSTKGSALTIGQSARNVSATTDIIEGELHGVLATDAPGTDVVGDTFRGLCGDQIQLAGASTGSTIENDVVTQVSSTTTCPGDGAQISVASGSTTGTTLDYNVVNPPSPEVAYNWGGSPYSSHAALNSAVGQGAHDIQADPKLGQNSAPQEGSPAIDSANASVLGETTVDFYGHARVTDPLTSPGAGSGPLYDRGAVELQDPYKVTGVTVDKTGGNFPLAVTATAVESNPWNAAATYTWSFGDGTPNVVTTSPIYTHTYNTAPAAGQSYSMNVTVRTADGVSSSDYSSAIIPTDPGPLRPQLDVTRVGDDFTLSVHVDTSLSADPLPIVHRTVSFGDHTADADASSTGAVDHTYASGGQYTVTVTETDSAGRVNSNTTTATVGELAVERYDLFGRDAAGNLWRYEGTGRADAPYHARTLVGGGWNSYNLVTLPDGLDARGWGAMFARDTHGVLWFLPGGSNTGAVPSRVRVGGGWNIYSSIVGVESTGLVARDANGVLWLYSFTGQNGAPLHSRIRLGAGWNAYSSIVGVGVLGGTNGGSLVARDTHGVLWLYQGTGNPHAPFNSRIRIGSGWNAYTSIVGARDLNNDGVNDLVARDAHGVLWMYEGTNNPHAPYRSRIRVGGGWNAYNLLFG